MAQTKGTSMAIIAWTLECSNRRLTNRENKMKPFIKKIQINGIDVNVAISIEVDETDGFTNDFYENKDIPRIQKLIDADKLFLGTITVQAYAHGIQGIDSLSACELVPNNLFDSKPFEASVLRVIEDNSMIENAIDCLVTQIQSRYEDSIKQGEFFKRFARGAK